jgi:TRAP-type C4-dicarboxylate transport system substrate-binding protein
MKLGIMSRFTAIVGALAFGSSAQAQDRPVELTFSHFVPQNFVLFAKGTGGGFGDWAESIDKASNGTIKIKFFPAGQLGPPANQYDLARDGIADIAWASPGYNPGRFPIAAAAELPYTFKDGANGSRALHAWYSKYAPKEMEAVRYLVVNIHNPGTFYTRTKMVRPEDYKGLKIRASTATMGKWISLLGANAAFMPTSEALDALQKGVVDAMTFAAEAAEQFGYTTVVPHLVDMPMYTTVFTTVMNKAKYQRLSAAQRKVIDEHTTEDWVLRIAGPWNEADKKMLTSFRNRPDRFVHAVPPEELARWHKLGEPLTKAWGEELKKKTQLDPEVVLSELRANIQKYDR